jgi:hypothetical protein
MRRKDPILNEFKIGGLVYSDEGNYMPIFEDGLVKAFNILSSVAQSVRELRNSASEQGKLDNLQGEDTSKFQQLLQLRNRILEQIKSGVSTMAESISNNSVSGENLIEVAFRFNQSVLQLVNEFRGTTTRGAAPIFDYIPGASQAMDKMDLDKWNSGIWRKQSDHAQTPGFQKVLTQSMEVADNILVENKRR